MVLNQIDLKAGCLHFGRQSRYKVYSVMHLPVLLLISPAAHGTQSKQQRGSPFLMAFLVPAGQISLHTEMGT